jgi:hypothetical protein
MRQRSAAPHPEACRYEIACIFPLPSQAGTTFKAATGPRLIWLRSPNWRSTDMETFFWSLLLAAISAITYVAYKHPRFFTISFGYPLIGLVIFGVIMVTASNLGGAGVLIDNSIRELSRMKGDKSILEKSLDNLKDVYQLQVTSLVIGSAAVVYLLLLISLPRILLIDSKKTEDKNSDG